MEYIEDVHFEYKDALLHALRAYNLAHTGERASSTAYFYALDGEKLIGSMHVQLSWDWVSIGDLWYENTEALKRMISEVCQYYRSKAVGMKLYTSVKSRADDFVSIGFFIGGFTEKTPRTPQYMYINHPGLDITSDSHTEVIMSKDPLEQYRAIASDKLAAFNKENHIEPIEETPYMYVALDGDAFVGGIHATVAEDSMSIDWLIVKEAYRGSGVGKTLVGKIEEKAKALGVFSINLGTVEFQAEKFYTRLGYKTVFVKENDPKGFRSFSMIKQL